MAQAHPVQTPGAHAAGGGGSGDHVEHVSHPRPRTYILVFVVLFIVTLAEVFVAVEPLRSIVPQLPALLSLAVAKGLLIVAFYMHLKHDSRLFTALFATGMILATSMILTFVALFYFSPRMPFDELGWRETLARDGTPPGAGGGTGAPAGGAGGATGGTTGGQR